MAAVKWIIVLFIGAAIGWFGHLYYGDTVETWIQKLQTPSEQTMPVEERAGGELCAQVITPAINPETKEIKEFPTPCDVPEGWDVIENDIPAMNLEVQ